MEFTLAHGTANDFVVLPDLDDEFEVSADLARRLCDRRRGLGADGVLRLGAPPGSDADVFMDHRNADGSTAKMCGNGVRVVVKHLLDHQLLPDADATAQEGQGRVVRVATRSGVKHVRVVARHRDGTVDRVAVDMGAPVLATVEIPYDADDPPAVVHHLRLAPDGPVDAWGGDEVAFTVVSMGNPHAVVLVDDVASAPVAVLGSWLEHHPRFPSGANVGFVEVLDRATVRLRVWERGVGETAACGTGACAAVVALRRRGLVDVRVAVQLPGGTLDVEYEPGGTVVMTGPAVEVAHGVLDAGWLSATDRDERDLETP